MFGNIVSNILHLLQIICTLYSCLIKHNTESSVSDCSRLYSKTLSCINWCIFIGHGLVEDDNSYMTWDTKYGEFDDRPETIDYVVSSPRSEMLRGLFALFSRSGLTSTSMQLIPLLGWQKCLPQRWQSCKVFSTRHRSNYDRMLFLS